MIDVKDLHKRYLNKEIIKVKYLNETVVIKVSDKSSYDPRKRTIFIEQALNIKIFEKHLMHELTHFILLENNVRDSLLHERVANLLQEVTRVSFL